MTNHEHILRPNDTGDDDRVLDHVRRCLRIGDDLIEQVALMKAKDLPGAFQPQRLALQDGRLDDVTIAVIPDELWTKGQPSESSAEHGLILFKQSYFDAKEPDEIAWMLHELAHCQNYFDAENAEQYQKDMERFAFDDLGAEFPYPNNPVERDAFTKQFRFLKDQGKTRAHISALLKQYYAQDDFPFFDRLLDTVFGE